MADRTFTPQLPGSRLCECGVLAEHHGEGMRCPAASSFPRPPRDEAEREACEFWTDKREMGPAHSCLVRSPHSNNCCTRRVGHEGDHVDSTTRDVIEARWPATPAEPSPLTERLAEALRRLHAVAHPESKDALRCLYAALLAEYDASRAVPPVTTEAREPAPTPSTQGATWRREPPTVEEVRGCPEWKFQRESGGTVEIELRVSEEFGVIDDDGDAVASHKFYRRGEWSPCLPPGTAPTPPDEVRDAAQRLLAYMDGRAVSHCNVHPQCTDQDNPLRRENWCPWCTAVGDLRDALAAVRAPRRGR